VYLIQIAWVKLLGGLYLLYLTYSHFFGRREEGLDRHAPPQARPMFGLSALWATIVRVELVNLAFSIDSILVAVAMSPKRWVVITGGILGIVALRLVVGQLIGRGEPVESFGRHAVRAPQVAPVGERYAQISSDPPEGVRQHRPSLRGTATVQWCT